MFGRKRKGDSGLDKIRETTDLAVDVENLVVKYVTSEETVEAVNSIDLKLKRKRTLGLVGETGAGKTTAMLALMNMVPSPPGVITEGSIKVNGLDMRKLTPAQLQAVRGSEIAMIFQDPMTSLNPVYKIGKQVGEGLRLHRGYSKQEALKRATELLDLVGIPEPEKRVNEYPHQFSGGMKQRVVIAMALACNPKLLLADEPTTALDVTIQAQVLETMKDLRKKFGSAMIMITHDLGIIAEVCDEVSVVYAGQIVEHGTLEDIFNHTMHPYTEGLFGSLPNIEDRKARLQPIPGLMPDPTNLPKGCPFSPRCKYCTEACKKDRPEKKWASDTHYVRCVRYEEPGFSIERSEQ